MVNWSFHQIKHDLICPVITEKHDILYSILKFKSLVTMVLSCPSSFNTQFNPPLNYKLKKRVLLSYFYMINQWTYIGISNPDLSTSNYLVQYPITFTERYSYVSAIYNGTACFTGANNTRALIHVLSRDSTSSDTNVAVQLIVLGK